LKRPFEGVEYQREDNTIELGCILQRLFSTFPNSWPGVGLLLLRVCLGIALICFGIAGLSGKPSESITLAPDLIAFGGGIFLLVGLWTPVIGTAIALNEVWIALLLYSLRREDTWIHVFLGVLSVSLAMLGPGAWSIDARLFGRKRFDIDRTRGRRPSL
jgi:Predicted membrane protein